jgi:hypothetical protein
MLPLSPAAMLLRGCSLCNTHRIYGLVIYAGGWCKYSPSSSSVTTAVVVLAHADAVAFQQ